MKLLWTSVFVPALLLASCSNEPQQSSAEPAAPTQEEQVAEPASEPIVAPKTYTEIKGAVVETMDSGGYTYVLVDVEGDTVWAAGPQAGVSVGDEVTITDLIPMPDFHSSTLERDFEMIYFTSAISGGNEVAAAVAAVHGALDTQEAVVADIEKAEGELTVEDIFLRKDEFIGKQVELHGKVVKFSAAIMNTNWLHLQDGSGSEGTNDLTITTDATVAVGDEVVIRGVLIADKDFGYGYKYDLIIEGAEVTVE